MLPENINILNNLFIAVEGTSSLLMFVNKSMFWATIIYMIIVFLQGIMLLNKIKIDPNSDKFQYIITMYNNGVFLFLYILTILGIYVYCIQNSYQYIQNNEISDSWSYYAKIIGVIMIFITLIINNMVNSPNQIEPYHSYGICIAHILLLFVYFQFIISKYYQTDGFTI